MAAETTSLTPEQQVVQLRAEIADLKAASTETAHQAALSHAWEHFSYHANQRLVTFRFYLITVAIFFSGYLKFMSDNNTEIAMIVAILGFILSYIFLRLDFRNKDLVKVSEEALKIEEEKLSSKVGYDEIELIKISDSSESGRWLLPKSFGQSLKLFYNIMIALFLFGTAITFCPAAMPWFGVENEQRETRTFFQAPTR